MEHHGSTALKLSLVDISRLAMVKRPVVSMWRSRYKNSNPAFPDAVEVQNNQELFLADEIVEWLQDTGNGNNPDAAEDMAAFASQARDNFDLVTALLTVRTLGGTSLSGMHPEDVLDLADGLDPDDEFIFSELEVAVVSLEPLLAYVDQLVDAAFTAPAAFEKLMKDRSRFQRTDALFDDRALELVALAAKSMAGDSPAFAEATPGGSDLLVAIASNFDEATSVMLTPVSSPIDPARLAQRRLKVHASSQDNILFGEQGISAPGQVTVAHFPAMNHSKLTDIEILTTIDDVALELADSQAALVLAPAHLLTDKITNNSASQIRDTLLRSGKLRAVVRLPSGLLKSRPRQHMALWVLGKEQKNLAIADRWTAVADLSTIRLDRSSIQDLVADLLASLESRQEVKARAFRFTRLVKTRILLASDGNLYKPPAAISSTNIAEPNAAEMLITAETLLEKINSSPQAENIDILIDLGTSAPLPPLTFGSLIKDKYLKLIPGTRFHFEDTAAVEGYLVIGAPELLSGNRTRFINRLQLAAQYPQGQFTEPGDVIFSNIGTSIAWIDFEGLNVVEYPARILRINKDKPTGLIPAVITDAFDNPLHGSWRRWHVKRFHEEQLENTTTTLKLIDKARQQALDRAAELEQLSTLLIRGTANAALKITSSTSTLEGNN